MKYHSNAQMALLLLSFFFFSCHDKNQKSNAGKERLTDFKWMLGEWRHEYADGSLLETWNIRDDSSLVGNSAMVKGKDTVLSEKMLILVRDSGVIFVPTVKGQNNSLPVTFKMISQNDSITVFENRVHDFPQWIQYKKQGDTALLAEIYGLKDSRFLREKFPMRRVSKLKSP